MKKIINLRLFILYFLISFNACLFAQVLPYKGNEENDIFLIGLGGSKSRDIPLINEALLGAFNKQIVYGAESVVRDEARELEMATSLGYDQKGYFYGIESSVANAFCDIVHYYRYMPIFDLISYQEQEALMIGIAQIASNCKYDPLTKKLFRKFLRYKKFNRNVSKRFLKWLDHELTTTLKGGERSAEFAYQKDFLLSNKALIRKDFSHWREFLKAFGLYFMEEVIAALPEKIRPDLKQLEDFFHHPEDPKNVFFARFEINRNWRDGFIARNILELHQIAIELKKPLFILIGNDHISTLEEALKRVSDSERLLKQMQIMEGQDAHEERQELRYKVFRVDDNVDEYQLARERVNEFDNVRDFFLNKN